VELSEQAAQELAEGSTAIGRVAELEARVAELEAHGRQLEAEKVEAEKALRKEKCGKESDCCAVRHCLSLTCLLLRAGGLHQGQRGAAQAPRGSRGPGGRNRREASPGPASSTRYDSEIIQPLGVLNFCRLG